MKLFFFMICTFSIILFCHAAIKKKYISTTSNNYFAQRYNSEYLKWPTTDRTAEGIGRLTTSLLYRLCSFLQKVATVPLIVLTKKLTVDTPSDYLKLQSLKVSRKKSNNNFKIPALSQDIHARAGKGFNIILSPISIWSMLAMLFEGSGGQTEVELAGKLQISYFTPQEGRGVVRSLYQMLKNHIKAKKSPSEFTFLNFIINDKSKPINPLYVNMIKQLYDGEAFDIDNSDVNGYANMINYWARDSSEYKIPTIISPAILSNLVLIIGNAVYFKSKWKFPFDVSETVYAPFKDENEKLITNVPMMNQFLILPHSYSTILNSQIIEIPYSDEETSMIIILPKERISLLNVLSKMTYLDVDIILPRNMTEEPIQLSMPKFNVISKMNLNEILKKDIPTVFDSETADFPYIGKYVYVSKITHRAEIRNTEEGTTASAISSAQFTYKTSGSIFRADRPFIYLINEINTRTVLFAGTYSNPYSG